MKNRIASLVLPMSAFSLRGKRHASADAVDKRRERLEISPLASQICVRGGRSNTPTNYMARIFMYRTISGNVLMTAKITKSAITLRITIFTTVHLKKLCLLA